MKSHVQPSQPAAAAVGAGVQGGGAYDLVADLQHHHRECEALNQKIQMAAIRRRYSADPNEAEKAREQERRYLADLDELMTRIRLIERDLRTLRGELVAELH